MAWQGRPLLERHAAEGAGRGALGVDHLSENRDVLRRALENEGWQVGVAEHGRVALVRVDDHAPSLILLDLMMPDRRRLSDGWPAGYRAAPRHIGLRNATNSRVLQHGVDLDELAVRVARR